MKVVQAYGPPPGGFHHPYANSSAFCGCNFPEPRSGTFGGILMSGVAGTSSYPDAGKCAEISGCGQCCRTASVQQTSMTPDQVNTARWDKGSTNLVLGTPSLASPSNGQLFSNYPRTTTLTWQPVSGATGYRVDLEYAYPSSTGYTWYPLHNQDVTSTSLTFDFVGSQPGRWRVTALDSTGAYEQSLPSAWRTFYYTR